MNALANSQLEELGKFLGDYGDQPPVTFGATPARRTTMSGSAWRRTRRTSC
jgi:ATP-dependent helicase YprA (DUF1998 family)